MKRVLLTGATGFVGRHAVPALLARGFEVHAVTSRSPAAAAAGLVWHRADLLEPDECRRLLESVHPSHLLHLAWTVEPGAFWTSPENLRWVGASLDLIRSFGAVGGRRMVLAGTCAEYEWGSQDLSETQTPIAPGTLYAACKDAVHRVAASFARQQGIELAWIRLFFLYGPHEPESRLVSSVTTALLRGEVARCGSGDCHRDYLHVADAADACAAVVDSLVQGAVNVASGEAVPIRRIVETLGAVCGRPDLIALGSLPDRAGDPPRICADTHRLRGEVGWQSRWTLDEGLRATAEWWKGALAGRVRAGAY